MAFAVLRSAPIPGIGHCGWSLRPWGFTADLPLFYFNAWLWFVGLLCCAVL